MRVCVRERKLVEGETKDFCKSSLWSDDTLAEKEEKKKKKLKKMKKEKKRKIRSKKMSHDGKADQLENLHFCRRKNLIRFKLEIFKYRSDYLKIFRESNFIFVHILESIFRLI